MNCYYHEDRAAVAQCEECHVGLCRECSDKYDVPLCEKCSDAVAGSALDKAKKTVRNTHISLIVCSVIGIVFMAYIAISAEADFLVFLLTALVGVFLGYYFTAIPSGWRAVSKVTDIFSFILILPIMGWLMFYAIKLGLAAFVGIFALPVEYIKARKTIKELS